ncbi:hypothetical protein [Marinobacter shengliensis]|uniref:hypothetical protein n=1 Tax=Marinobacter shengliensis TaxID=1389223 RepID=UPI0011098ACF|nr:hypothetical protein [Marinobacter shengliensis]
MSRKSLGTLTLDLVAQTGGFVQGMDKAERQSEKWRRQVEKDLKKVNREAQVRLKGVTVAAAGAAAGLATMAVVGMRNVDSQTKLARSLDTTYDSVSALQIAFGEAGIDNFEASMNRLNRRLGAAELGRGSALHAVKELSLDLRELSGLEADERLAVIADRIRDVSDNSQQAARYAQDLGFEQREAAAFFMQGGDAIRGYRKEVDEFGLALSAIETHRVEEANDEFAKLGRASTAVQQRLAVGLAPVVTQVSKHITDSFKDASGTMQTDIDQAIQAGVEGMATMVDASATMLEVINDNPMSAQFGVLGWLLLGPKGALIGAAIGATFDVIEEGLARVGVGISDAEDSARKLANIQEQIQRQEEIIRKGREIGHEENGRHLRDAAGELIELRKIESQLQEEVSSSSEAQDKYNELINAGTENASGFSGSLRRLASSLREIDWDNATPEGSDSGTSGGGGIFGGDVDESLQRRREAIRQSFESERQTILRIYGQQEEEIRALRDQGVISKLEADQLMWQNEQQMFEKRQDLREKELEAQRGYWDKWLQAAQSNLENFDDLSKTVIDNFTTGFGNAFESVIIDSESVDDALKGIAETILRSVVNALGQMAAQWLALQAVQMATGSAATAATVGQAAIAGAAWAPAAAAASLATLGTNVAPASSALVSTHALSKTLALTGMAHDGIDSVPKEGTWLLDKGERVLTSETSAKLDATLNQVLRNTAGGGSGTTVNVIEDSSRAGQTETQRGSNGEEEVNVFVADIMGGGRRAQAIQTAFGLRRQGN